jgi:general secretion pathway protein C
MIALLPRRSTLPRVARILAILAAAAGLGVWGVILFAPRPGSLPAALQPSAQARTDTDPAALLFGKNGALHTQVTLAGVIAAGNDGAAVLSVDGGPNLAWHTGQEVAPGVRLVQVQGRAVVLDQNGTRASVALPELPAANGIADASRPQAQAQGRR